MASYLDARAHHGLWILRIEDIDTPRIVSGADHTIMHQLQALGMQWDTDPIWQSHRLGRYREVFNTLQAQDLIYGCACTRKETSSGAYPGTCRNGLAPGIKARAWRLRVTDEPVQFNDRWFGPQKQNVAREIGDFIIKRADNLWAYQFAVVIDDYDQGITDVVRGADLLSSTARQHVLMRLLGGQPPRVLHVPLVCDVTGHKLSKQNHARPLDSHNMLQVLQKAWLHLGFSPLPPTLNIADFWRSAIPRWAIRFNI